MREIVVSCLRPAPRPMAMALSLALATAVLAGCPQPSSPFGNANDGIAAPLDTISVYQLAGRLDMEVARSSQTLAVLRDPANIVMVYPDPNGQIYVNGEPVGRQGGIIPVGGMLFVPRDLASDIRKAMNVQPAPSPEVIQPPVRPGPSGPGPGRFRVVIDAGHGGNDPGARAVTGAYESPLVLDAAMAVADGLRSRLGGGNVIVTRDGDTFIALNDRAEVANEARADAFVSIHADSCADRGVRGFTIYVARSASDRSLALARAIESRMLAAGVPGRGIREANYRVLVRTTCPAVLVELGYLSNVSEARKMSQEGYRQMLAAAICQGIIEFSR